MEPQEPPEGRHYALLQTPVPGIRHGLYVFPQQQAAWQFARRLATYATEQGATCWVEVGEVGRLSEAELLIESSERLPSGNPGVGSLE